MEELLTDSELHALELIFHELNRVGLAMLVTVPCLEYVCIEEVTPDMPMHERLLRVISRWGDFKQRTFRATGPKAESQIAKFFRLLLDLESTIQSYTSRSILVTRQVTFDAGFRVRAFIDGCDVLFEGLLPKEVTTGSFKTMLQLIFPDCQLLPFRIASDMNGYDHQAFLAYYGVLKASMKWQSALQLRVSNIRLLLYEREKLLGSQYDAFPLSDCLS